MLGPPPLSEAAAYAPDHFARSLIGKLRARIALLAQPVTTTVAYHIDDEPLLVLPASTRRAPIECATQMSYAFSDLILPAAAPFQKEVATEGSLWSGESGSYRALYAADSLHLARNSTIIERCHADIELKGDEGYWSLGRVLAHKTIKVDARAGSCR